jgi:hypothetical protein
VVSLVAVTLRTDFIEEYGNGYNNAELEGSFISVTTLLIITPVTAGEGAIFTVID